jgi:gamma-tubulin complex component 3
MQAVIRDNNTPEKALKFSNLYSRLLSQPVLSQKWAMLYFMYQLSDPPLTNPLQESRPSASNRMPSYNTAMDSNAQTSPPTPKRPPDQHQFDVNSPAFNQAFSNAGLLKLPQTEEPGSAKADRPISRQRRDRTKEKEAANGDAEPGISSEPQVWVKYDALTPSEPNLLRDLPFTFQGLSSTHFNFASNKILKLPDTLPVPILGLLHSLAEPCLLYKRLSEFVESNDGGLVGQSFRSALSIELRAYLGLVATLEGQIRRALAQLDDAQPRQGIGKAGVTLKRCVVWTREATMGLRLMSLMVEESKSLLHFSPLWTWPYTNSKQTKKGAS